MRAPSLALLLLLGGCAATGTLEFPGLQLDDDDTSDDDDTGVDDDDTGVDDDDTGDDDDTVVDDDDIIGDDDDSVGPCPGEQISCGDVVQSSNADGTNQFEWYSCVGEGLTGPETTYSFFSETEQEVSVTLGALSDDLDLYIIEGGVCDPGECAGGSWNSENQAEEFTFDASAAREYVIFVDGWAGAVSEYRISVDCAPLGDDDDTVGDDDDSVGVDADFDGYDASVDCEDNNPAVNPGAIEICDGVDNDCTMLVDDNGACFGCTPGSDGGHTYQACTGFPTNFTGAQATCAGYGYYLVTIDDGGEDAFLVGLAASAGGNDSFWIGYTDAGFGNEGNFSWVGAPSSTGYENWNSGEPNNSGNEDCVEMGQGSSWAWNDIGCNSTNFFICEGDF